MLAAPWMMFAKALLRATTVSALSGLWPVATFVAKLVALTLPALAVGANVHAFELGGYVAGESRGFMQHRAFPRQRSNPLSLVLAPEFYRRWGDGRDSFVVSPFLRVDSADPERTHFDLREALYWHAEDSWELRAGIGKVFWGVTESRHLIDVVNQTDFVEDIDGEDKLGQPMLALTLKPTWGTWDLFVLPGFRERTFAGPRGRLRYAPHVDADAASYESSAEQKHIDYAVRWSAVLGDVDIGVSHFIGTSRFPRLLPGSDLAGNPVLRPHYDQVQRSAVDVQATLDAWLLKFEGLVQSGSGSTYEAFIGGFEHTLYGIGGGATDVGLLAEYLFDGRGRHAPQPFANDLYLGVRVALNDVNSSSLLAGVIYDLNGQGQVFSIEASRRIDDNWRIEIESRIWTGIAAENLQRSLRKDDYITLRVLRYF